MKKTALIFTTALTFLATTAHASLSKDTPAAATLHGDSAGQTKPIPVSRNLAINTPPTKLIEKNLNEYDYVEVQVSAQNFPNLKLKAERLDMKTLMPKGGSFFKTIKENEEVYLWYEQKYFDQWGEPGTDLAQYNGFQQEVADSGIGLNRSSPSDFFMSLTASLQDQLVDMVYDPAWDPATIDFLEDGATVQQILYMAFKSECSDEPLCPAYSVATTGDIGSISINIGDDATVALKENSSKNDPNPIITNIMAAGEPLFFQKDKNEVLKVVFKKK